MADEKEQKQESPVVDSGGLDAAAESRSLRAVVIGTSIIMWILALFIIYTLNGIKDQLEQLNTTLNDVATLTSSHALGNYQIVDRSGKVVYKFQTVPTNPEDVVPAGGSRGVD